MTLQKQLSTKKIILFSFITTLLGTAIILLGAEVAGRLTIWLKYGKPAKSYGLWRYDEVLGAQHRENAYNTNAETNNYGFRNKENVIEPKPDGALRIICYGGSTTYCYNLSNEETWPTQLERLLRQKRNANDQVLNAGAILWSLGHAYARAKKDIPRLRPDYAIIYSGINESGNAGYLKRAGLSMEKLASEGRYGVFAKNMDQNRWLKRNSVIVRFFDYKIKGYFARHEKTEKAPEDSYADKEVNKPDKYILENYLMVLRYMLELCTENHVTPVFVIQTHGRKNRQSEYLTSYSREGAKLAGSEGCIVVDADRLVREYSGKPMDLFSETGVHLSALGARMLASLIYDQVFQHSTLP